MKPLAIGTFAIAALSVSLGAAENSRYQPDPRWTPPAQAVAQRNPLANAPEATAGGRKLYLRECAECHAEDGTGLNNAANLRLPVVQNQSDGALFWKITGGNPPRGMPAWSRLPEKQRWQIILYLRSLR